MMANRSSQTVTMYCTSQSFRHLWITIYGLVGDDIKELIGYRRELHHIMTTATSSIGKTMLKLSSDLINEHRPQTPGGEDLLIKIVIAL